MTTRQYTFYLNILIIVCNMVFYIRTCQLCCEYLLLSCFLEKVKYRMQRQNLIVEDMDIIVSYHESEQKFVSCY